MPIFQYHSQFELSSLNDLDIVVSALRRLILHPVVIYLYGDLGTGKTTFAQHWLRQAGVSGAITSPTYTLANEYTANSMCFIHADLYRIHDPEELLYLDAREWRNNADVTLIEWPERGEGFIPEADMVGRFSLEGERRTLLWQTKVGLELKTPLSD